MRNDLDEQYDDGLKKLDVSGGFKVPDGYFDRLRTHTLNRTVQNDQNQQALPADYFDRSRAAILSKTVGASPKIKTLWYRQPLFRYAAAAAAVITTLSVAFWPTRFVATPPTSLSSISDEEILHYLEQTDLRDITISDVNFASVQPSNAEVEQYIINQSDEHLLLEHL